MRWQAVKLFINLCHKKLYTFLVHWLFIGIDYKGNKFWDIILLYKAEIFYVCYSIYEELFISKASRLEDSN